MSVSNELPSDLAAVDIIIAGGGTSGLVVAARLHDAYPNLSILVIEEGPTNENEPAIAHPLLFFTNLSPEGKFTSFYQASGEDGVNKRSLVVPSGGVLGGGSSINIMTYSRPQREDLDSWKTSGWSADELIPFLKKFETYHGHGTDAMHGSNGPVHVSNSAFHVEETRAQFIAAAGEKGFPFVDDLQNLDSCNAVSKNLRWISPDGRRQDSAHAYLFPRVNGKSQSTLRVLTENHVTRVLFEGKRAVGVEYKVNPRFGTPLSHRTIRANKRVILSAGALGTPSILERSGVGNSEILDNAGIEVVSPLPGVGSNYKDHLLLTCSYWSSLSPEQTSDAIYSGRRDMGELIANNDPILGWNMSDVTSKIRPSEDEAKALGAPFWEEWQSDYQNVPNKPLSIWTSLNGFAGDPSGLPAAQFMSSTFFTLYPKSTGHIHITSKDIDSPSDFQTGFLSDPKGVDIKACVWSYKKQREIMRRVPAYRGELDTSHPSFPATSEAACKKLDIPLDDIQDINYTAEDDRILEDWIRNSVGTTWHSMGTCKMAPLEEDGVVDSSLSVYGTENLKIADMSIPPQNVGCNTASVAYMIGEKAADIFIRELEKEL